MLILVAVGRDQVRAVRGTVDGNFALRATADGADFLALRRTKSCCFSFFTDRTGHSGPQSCTDKPAEYSRDGEKAKRLKDKTAANHGLVAGVNRHGIAGTLGKVCAGNCGEAGGAIDQDDGDRS